MDNSSHSPLITKPPRQRTSNGVVDAFIIQTPDVAVALRLQNLILFLLDSTTTLSSEDIQRKSKIDQVTSCLNHIDSLLKTYSNSLESELVRVINELLEEGRQFENILRTFLHEIPSFGTPAEALIAGKSSHLQWLGVCILEEIKKTFFK